MTSSITSYTMMSSPVQCKGLFQNRSGYLMGFKIRRTAHHCTVPHYSAQTQCTYYKAPTTQNPQHCIYYTAPHYSANTLLHLLHCIHCTVPTILPPSHHIHCLAPTAAHFTSLISLHSLNCIPLHCTKLLCT